MPTVCTSVCWRRKDGRRTLLIKSIHGVISLIELWTLHLLIKVCLEDLLLRAGGLSVMVNVIGTQNCVTWGQNPMTHAVWKCEELWKQALDSDQRGFVAEIDGRVDAGSDPAEPTTRERPHNLSGSSGDMESSFPHFKRPQVGLRCPHPVEAQSTMESDVSIHRSLYIRSHEALFCVLDRNVTASVIAGGFPK